MHFVLSKISFRNIFQIRLLDSVDIEFKQTRDTAGKAKGPILCTVDI